MINGPVDKESARHLTIRGNKASEESFKLKHLTERKDIKRLTRLHHERVDSSDSESDPHPDSDEPKSGSHESPLPLPASVSAEASKRRKRLASSCLTCRKRKVKCDLNYPIPGKRGDHVKEADEPEERKHPKSQVDGDECWQYLLNTISTHMELAEENTWSDTDSASLRAGTETKWMGYPFKPPIPPFIKMNKNAGNDGTPTSPETAVKRQRVATFTVDVRKEELREYERRAKRVMEDQEKLARDTVLAASGACPICLQKKVPCHHHGMLWDVANKKCGNPREDSTAKELAPSTAGNHEQQSDTLYQEGTVADSGYVSAGASRSIHGSKLREELREDGTTAQQEAQDPLAVDQQTVYTSPILPHGSDYISDLCNDIHLKLKDDLQEQAHDQDRVELLNCLPDLIKALSIRIGFDISNPSRTYVMHFLHTHYR
ncbi:hypothetical protein Daus18300_012283 [Diaporthe australafricana]|uniref:Zn(2)-C6 fungal-type domain-containing protein n=1 Tax=Diaporthe australafricana TaxID=127596 RepID=A0ABR3W3H1_9PEZI